MKSVSAQIVLLLWRSGRSSTRLLFWLVLWTLWEEIELVSSPDLYWEPVLQQLPANIPRSA